ncbi:hypothetical protein L873DRAFT_1397904 [Choiromyces venosus 120613-1]|uniref:Uncharacterized protein n=1 Tax=Choiromyces venosus 120613-1 TaxID=1336337 RepID=A0A3N4J955_9PEZI|nr:hypothetical protein L873DRAFT_1397904 [Choiromyces venosus 120613-1]
MSEKKMHKYTATIVGFSISISLSNQAACGPRGKNFLYLALSESKTKSKELWTSEYRPSLYTDGTPAESSAPTRSPSVSEFHLPQDDTLSRWKQKKRARLTMGDIDQFERFQAAGEEEEVPDLLAYWALRFSNPRWS